MRALSAGHVRLLKETARRFADASLRPLVRQRPTLAQLPQAVATAHAELGLGLTGVPRSMGGLALGPYATCLVAEALAAGDVNSAFSLPQPGAFAELLARLGSTEQQVRWGRAFADVTARAQGALAYAPRAPLTAVAQPGGAWRIDGHVACAWRAAGADRLLILAERQAAPTDAAPAPQTDLSADMVAAVVALPHPQVRLGPGAAPGGLEWAGVASLSIDNLVVAAQDTLGTGDLRAPVRLALACLDVQMASFALGAARASSAYVLDFAEARRQSNRPLAHFQSMGFLLVDMHLACETAVGRLRDAAMAAQPAEASLLPADGGMDVDDWVAGVAAARAEAEEVAFFVTDSAVQILDDGHEKVAEHPISAWHHDVQALACAYGPRGAGAGARTPIY